MKRKKSTLYTMIVLLVITLPLGLLGLYRHFKNNPTDIILDNPNHELLYEGKLYFYDENDSLIGTYECQNADCGYAETTIDDLKYNLDYFEGEKTYLDYNVNDLVFLKDGKNIFLYGIKTGNVMVSYDALKDYHTTIENNILIAKQNGKWGVFSLDTLNNILPFKYDFIGLPKKVENDILLSQNYIVYSDNRWYVFDNENNAISQGVNEAIKNFNSNYILTVENKLYDYRNNLINVNLDFQKIDILGDYIIVLLKNNALIVYKNIEQNVVSGRTTLGEYNNITYELDNNNLIIYGDGTMATTIALN